MEEKIVLREDLNEIVKKIGFAEIRSSYGTRHPLRVIIENGTPTGKTLEIRDKDGVYDAIESYRILGEKDYIKSKELVEEISTDAEGNETKPYVCIKYELNDGNIFRFFLERSQQIIVDNMYKLYKKNQKSPVKQG